MALSSDAHHVVDALKALFSKDLPDAEYHVFGSSANGFSEPGSDVDITIQVSDAMVERFGNLTKHELVKAVFGCVRDITSAGKDPRIVFIETVQHARIPIVKLSVSNIQCDLSINNILPVFNTRLLASYAQLDQRVVKLVHSLKKWAKKHQVHGATNGHLSTYSFTLMAIFFMQAKGVYPSLQALAKERTVHEDVDTGATYDVSLALPGSDVVREKMEQRPDQNVTLRDFLLFYAEEFKWGSNVISVRLGSLEPMDSDGLFQKLDFAPFFGGCLQLSILFFYPISYGLTVGPMFWQLMLLCSRLLTYSWTQVSKAGDGRN
jgi:DNA polymerase sigma